MNQIIQYRDDLVRCFVDTEFYEDGSTVDLISIGAVRSDGEEFYAVNQDAKLDRVSQWVRENVLPQLPPYSDKSWRPRKQIAEEFSRFMASSRRVTQRKDLSWETEERAAVHEVWGYYSDYDWVAICQMYGTMMGLPNHFPRYCLDLKQLSWMLGNPKHPKQETGEHNALEDARWNKKLFEFLRCIQTGRLLQIAEEERQMLLLALAHLSNERPGWDDALNRIAVRIDNERDGRAVMYDDFKSLQTDRGMPADVLGMRPEQEKP